MAASSYLPVFNSEGIQVVNEEGQAIYYGEGGDLIAFQPSEATEQLQSAQTFSKDKQKDVIGEEENGIWLNHKDSNSRRIDKEATELLIQLFIKYEQQLNNSKGNRKNVWQSVSDEMCKEGFSVTKAKCHQKWRNLKRDFKKYIISSKGAVGPRGNKAPPEFYEELHRILGNTFEEFETTKTKTGDSQLASAHEQLEYFQDESDASCIFGEPSCIPTVVAGCDSKANKNKRPFVESSRMEDSPPRTNCRPSQSIFHLLKRISQESEEREERRFQELKEILQKQHQDRMNLMTEFIKVLSDGE